MRGNLMKIHLHIGTHKTGTTSIQAFAHENADLLLRHGVYWPDPIRLLARKQQHVVLRRLLQHGDIGTASRFVSEALKDADAAGAHTLLISSEGFSNAQEDEIAQLLKMFEGHEVWLVAYFRNIYGYARSAFLQHMKYASKRPPLSLTVSAIQRNLDYDALLARWRRLLPEAALDIRSYDREKANLVPAFFARLGVPHNEVRARLHEERNRSIDPAVQFLLTTLEVDNIGGDFRRTREAYFRAFGDFHMNAPLTAEIIAGLTKGAHEGLRDPLLAEYREELLAPPRPPVRLSAREQAKYFSSLARFSRSMARRKRFEASVFFPLWLRLRGRALPKQ